MDIQKEIYDDLVSELGIENANDRNVLLIKVKNAIREVKNRRSYPSHFTEQDILRDLESLYSNIHDIALYDYNQIGAEGQISHSDNSNSRAWKNREDCFRGVFAWAGF